VAAITYNHRSVAHSTTTDRQKAAVQLANANAAHSRASKDVVASVGGRAAHSRTRRITTVRHDHRNHLLPVYLLSEDAARVFFHNKLVK
jgi:Tfp pilus assembly PilM family ATPase